MKRTWLLAPVLAGVFDGRLRRRGVLRERSSAAAAGGSSRRRRLGPGYVWVNGYWGWRGNAHVWVAGSLDASAASARCLGCAALGA